MPLSKVPSLCLAGLALVGTFQPGPLRGQAPAPEGPPPVHVGLLIHFTADFQEDRTFPGENGFRVDRARIRIVGSLPGGGGFSLQTERSSLLEARISLPLLPETLVVDAGLLKPPLSAEFLQSSHLLDLPDRSQAVTALLERRDVGAQLRLRAGWLEIRGGVFNGGADPTGNLEEGFRWVVRGETARRGAGGDTLQLGGFVSRNGERGWVDGEGLGLRFQALHTLGGVDLRWARGRWFGSGEWLVGGDIPGQEHGPRGGQATLGRRSFGTGELTLRLDHLDPGLTGVAPSTLLLLGAGVRPSREVRLQGAGVIPLAGPGERPRVLLRTQLFL